MVTNFSFRFKALGIAFFLCLLTNFVNAQKDSVYHIALVLPLLKEASIERLNAISTARDLYTANRINFEENAQIALDFYQGATEALSTNKEGLKIVLSVYDCEDNDSITELILNKPELKKQDVIIGAVSTSTSKLVAEFCKKNKIINIQPFSPSKSLTSDNPYHLKLAPTIDAHADDLFNSIVDSFAGANVVIYTPDVENSVAVAKRLDSLFKDYNKKGAPKFTTALINAKDMMLNGVKTTVAEQLKPGQTNIVIMTAFEESFVNGNLRVLYSNRSKEKIIIYGMPNWLKGDIMRLDYLNDYNTRVSDGFLPDTAKTDTKVFNLNFRAHFGNEPSKYAYLGFDVMQFTLQSLKLYGVDFLNSVCTQRYPGVAYKFDVSKNKKADDGINFYENRHVNVFKVQDYQLKKVW